MNGSRWKVPAKAAEQSCVSVWRSAGFSTPGDLSLPRPVSPLVTWELLGWISVCLTGYKQGRGLGSHAPGSSALQNNRAGHTSPLTLQYVRECHCVLFPWSPTANPNRGNIQKKMSFLAGLLFLFSCLWSCFFSSHPHNSLIFLLSISFSLFSQLLNAVFFILHHATLTYWGLIRVWESLEATPAQPTVRP